MLDLREHQQDALDAITNMNSDAGRIVIPTGGGKTMVEAYALRDIINLDAQDIHVVLAPRIALVNQLIKEYREFIGQNYIAVAFHSGKYERDYERVRWAEQATTSIEVVREQYARAKRMGKDLVIFSTYASCNKLKEFHFDGLIADESQYCVSENYFNDIKSLTADKKLFFTATEKHTPTDKGRGLNNETVFGKVLFQVTPKSLIEKGYIVAPRLHIMSASAKDESYTVIDEVIQLAKKQAELSRKLPVTKVLFAMKGTDDVKSIVEDIDKIQEAMPDFKVFTIVSNNKYGSMVDGNKMARGDFMKELRECDNALIFHYDILSEGIDVDGITGVAILRNMQHSKLLQTIGRAVRIYKADPASKRQAWVSVVEVNGNDESRTNVAATIIAIRDGGFEVNIEEVEFTDNHGFGISEDGEEIESLIAPDKRNSLMQFLSGVMHQIELAEYFSTFNPYASEEEILEEW